MTCRPRSHHQQRGGEADIRVRLPGPVLNYRRARRVLGSLIRRVRRGTAVELDLGEVRDIAAPWMPVFGLLLWVARKTRANYVLTHANRRVAAMASIALADLGRSGVRLA
jgi:hypothetical protein